MLQKGQEDLKAVFLLGTQLFCFGDYLMFKGTSTYHINSCEPIEIFYDLRIDYDKLMYAMHINKIVQDVTIENQNSFNILQLYLNTLYVITKTDKELAFILSIFKMRLLLILGFTPRINKCINCDSKEISYFSIKDDGVKCKNCGNLDKSAIRISEDALNAIKFVQMCPSKKLYSFNLKGEGLKEFNLVSKIYFNNKLEKEYNMFE